MERGRLKVGIKYCGHCNPSIDGPSLLIRLLDKLPELEVARWDSPQLDVLLIINACLTGCATQPVFAGPRIVIAAGEVRSWHILAGHPAEKLLLACRTEGVQLEEHAKYGRNK